MPRVFPGEPDADLSGASPRISASGHSGPTPDEPSVPQLTTANPVTTAKSAAPKPSAPRNPAHASVPKPGPPRPAAPKPGPPRPAQPAADAEPAPAKPAAVPAARKPERSSGPDIRLVSATPETALDVADETVDRLLDEGTAPDTILVLTTGEAHPWQQHEESFGSEPYWRQYTEGNDVFYARALGDRPLRRDTVVLVVNGFADPARSTDALVTAIASGTAAVIVCGDLDQVRALTGL